MRVLIWGLVLGAVAGLAGGWRAGRFYQAAHRAYGDYRGTARAVPKMRRSAWDAAVRSAQQLAGIGAVGAIAFAVLWKVS